MRSANISTGEIDVISAHATSTQVGDRSEVLAIKNLFGEYSRKIPTTANKSMTGHMLGAAGGVEAIALVESLRRGIIPPTINVEKQDPRLRPRCSIRSAKSSIEIWTIKFFLVLVDIIQQSC